MVSIPSLGETNLNQHVLDCFLLSVAIKAVLVTGKHGIATLSPSSRSGLVMTDCTPSYVTRHACMPMTGRGQLPSCCD